MGKIFSSVFGGSGSKQNSQSTSQSSSSNQAYPFLSETYAPQIQQGFDASNAYKSLLGLGDTPHAYDDAFQKYRDSTGYDFMFNQGRDAITNSAAARGMLNSGATLKALTQYGQNTASTKFNEYLDRLLGLNRQSLDIGNLLSGAGGTSTASGQSTSKASSYSKPGISDYLGKIFSGLPGG